MKNCLLIILTFYCFAAVGQPGSEIYVFDLKIKDGQPVLSNGVNITKHKGYDNQPSFHPSQSIIYYSSANDSGRTDIKQYDLVTKETKNLTNTWEREYSPTVTPDGKFISCIIQRDNGAQDLAKYPINRGKPIVLINHLKIGYHAWAGDNKLFLFVLDDSVNNSLHYYYLEKNADTVVAENIGRSLHRMPGLNAMSFIQRIPEKTSVIKKFDMSNGVISTITLTLPGQDHIVWLQNNTILMSDGKKVFAYRPGTDFAFMPVTVEGDVSMLKGVSRLATNADNTKLAVVVSE